MFVDLTADEEEEGMRLVDLSNNSNKEIIDLTEDNEGQPILPPLRVRPPPRVWSRPQSSSGTDEPEHISPAIVKKENRRSVLPPIRIGKNKVISAAAMSRAGDVATAVPKKPNADPVPAQALAVIELSPDPVPEPVAAPAATPAPAGGRYNLRKRRGI